MKLVGYLALIGLLLFSAVLIVGVSTSFFFPQLLVTQAFAAKIEPYALFGAIYAGLSLVTTHALRLVQEAGALARKRRKAYILKNAWVILVVLLSALLIGYLTYRTIIDVPADILHSSAPSEEVEFTATASSAWPSRKDLREGCQHHLLFEEPRLSPSIQFVCISWEQWLHFRDAEFPMQVTVYGKKSEYGYELKCCR